MIFRFRIFLYRNGYDTFLKEVKENAAYLLYHKGKTIFAETQVEHLLLISKGKGNII